MEEENNNIDEIETKIKDLKMKKKKIKQMNDRKLRLRSNNCGKSNVLIRVSSNLKKKIDYINIKREEKGLDPLSGPKITELQLTHKKCSPIIERDIICYNTNLDDENKGVEFNDR
jgi:phosphopantetheine adenylyltransferase